MGLLEDIARIVFASKPVNKLPSKATINLGDLVAVWSSANSRLEKYGARLLQSDWNEADANKMAHIKNKPTIPEYTIDIVANRLKLYKDGAEIGDEDLSLYLDDTNLARLTSGTLDSGTGIATFTRDDNSTFTIDFSGLIDVQDGRTYNVPRTDDTETAPTAAEVASPKAGDTATIILANNNVMLWSYNGTNWIKNGLINQPRHETAPAAAHNLNERQKAIISFDGGTYEGSSNCFLPLVKNISGIELALVPTGYKEDMVYSTIPEDGSGDFTYSGGGGTRVNKDGLIETVAANIPRLNYPIVNGVVGSCPHLLLEPTRTNQILYSEDFTNSVWQKLGGGTGTAPIVTANYATAPDGSNNADRVVMDMGSGTTGDNFSVIRNFGTSGSTGTNSVYIKSNTSDSYTIGIDNIGTVETVTVTPQWQRFSYSVTDTDRLQISLRGVGSQTSRYADVSMWGGSLENGTYPTSYIPTAGSAVTRTADTCKLENLDNAPTDYPFTIFCDFEVPKTGQKTFAFSFINIATTANYFTAGYNFVGGNKMNFENRSTGSTIYSAKSTQTYQGGRHKLAVKFISSTRFVGFVDGVEVVDYTHTSSPFDSGINDILLGQLRVAGDTGDRGSVNQFMLFNEALTNAELQTLTT